MVQLLDKPKTSFRILYLEDSDLCEKLFNKIANKNLKNVRVKTVKDSLSFYRQLPFENPHLIIADWHLDDGGIEFILDELSKFKGKVIIFSYLNKEIVENKIIEQIKKIPENFIILSKCETDSYKKITHDIKSCAYSLGIEV